MLNRAPCHVYLSLTVLTNPNPNWCTVVEVSGTRETQERSHALPHRELMLYEKSYWLGEVLLFSGPELLSDEEEKEEEALVPVPGPPTFSTGVSEEQGGSSSPPVHWDTPSTPRDVEGEGRGGVSNEDNVAAASMGQEGIARTATPEGKGTEGSEAGEITLYQGMAAKLTLTFKHGLHTVTHAHDDCGGFCEVG